MKKTLLIFAVGLLAVFSMNAQDLTLSWEGEELGETLTLWGHPDSAEIVFHVVCHNNTDRDLNVKVRRNQIEMVDGTSSQFCWGGSCWPPDVDESPSATLIPAGEQSGEEDFSAHYSPSSHNGTSTIEYTFFNEDDEDLNVKITVYYWASPDGIAEDLMKGGSISDIYPNPATSLVNIDYNLPSGVNSAKVRIVNLLGALVKESTIERNANKLTMDISDLKGGVYFYTVLINDDVFKTKKLLIQK
jgi:hypothetical protein